MALGTQLYYWDADTSAWVLETAKIKITIKDAAIGKPRTMDAVIVNTVNAVTHQHEKESHYGPFVRVKVVEYNTNNTIFIGRVEITQPTQDNSYGQILLVSARDYLQTLLDRKINSNYGTSAVPTQLTRSEMIAQIITEYNTPNATITTGGIAASPSTEKIFRQYAGSNKTVARAIEELAQEEPWSNKTWNGVFINSVNRTTSISGTDTQFLTAAGQYAYFSTAASSAPFVGINFTSISTVGSYGAITWGYYNGSGYTPFPAMLQIASLNSTGSTMVRWEVPLAWATGTVLGTTGYWARCSVASVGATVAVIKADCAVGVGFNYYIDENGVFQYFRKGSRPAGGPVANGLTVSLSPASASPLTQRQILANYEFTNQPKEIITRVYVKGTAADTGNVVSASACNTALEKAYNTVKEKWDFISGSGMNTAELTAYAQARANSLLYATSSTVNRGVVSVVKYPYYTVLNSKLIGATDTTTTGSNTLDVITFCKFTASASGSMAVFRIKMQSSDTVRTAIYADHAITPGEPGVVLKTSEEAVAVSAGWNDIVFPPVDLVSGTVYWLAFNTQASNTVCRASSGTGVRKFIATSFYNAFTDNPVTTSSDAYISMVQGYSATFTLIRAGDLVHAKCDMTDTDMDFEVTDIEYAEPNVSAKISLISPTAGRGQEPDDMSNILTRLNDGDNAVIPSARIGDLVAKKITANEILAGDIIVDIGLAPNGTGGGNLHSANYSAGVSGWTINYNGYSEFQNIVARGTLRSSNYSHGVAGWVINNSGSAEFQDVTIRGAIQAGKYLNASGGGFLAGASAVILDSSGVGIIGDGAISVSTARIRFANTSAGLYANNSYIYQSNGWLIMGTDSRIDGASINIGALSGDVILSAPTRDIDCSNAYVLNLPVKSATATGKDDGSLFYNSTTKEFMGKSNGSWITLGALSSPAHALDSASHTNSANLTSSLTATSARTGLMRDLSNVSGEYFNGTGGWTVPSGAGGGAYLPLSGGAMTGVIGAVANLSIQATGAGAVLSLISTGASSPIGIYCNANMVVQSNAGILYLNAPVGGMRMPVIARASEPAGSYEGQMYYDGTNHVIRHYNGSSWGDIGAGGHTQNTDTILTTNGVTQLFNAGVLVNNLTVSAGAALNATGTFNINSTGNATINGSGAISLSNVGVAGKSIYLWANTYIDCQASSGIAIPRSITKATVATYGSVYYDTSVSAVKYSDGTNWKTVSKGMTTDPIWTAKGDLAVGFSSSVGTVLTVGTNGYVLTADSTTLGGIKWAPSVGGSYLPLAGGTMSGNLNMYSGGVVHGNGVFTIDAITSLTLTAPNITLSGLVSGGLLSNHAWASAGDIVIGTGTDTATIFSAVGIPNGYVLTRQSAYANGVQWQAAAAMSSHALDGTTYHSALSNNTNFNVSTSNHGLCPILPNIATQYLNGQGAWTVPAGGGGIATDPIWDSAGDLAVGSGSNTAIKFSLVGIPNGYVLTRNSGYAYGLQWLPAAGSTVTLNTLTIDVAKNWAGYAITNIGAITQGVGNPNTFYDIKPFNTSSWIGYAANKWARIYVTQIGDASNKVTLYGSVIACPMPANESGIAIIKKIPKPVKLTASKIEKENRKMHDMERYGEDRLYYTVEDFPDECKVAVTKTNPDTKQEEPDGTDIEMNLVIGVLLQSIQELVPKIELLEAKIKKLEGK